MDATVYQREKEYDRRQYEKWINSEECRQQLKKNIAKSLEALSQKKEKIRQ